MNANTIVSEVFEGGAEQARAEFGAADADMDDVCNRLTVKTFPFAGGAAPGGVRRY